VATTARRQQTAITIRSTRAAELLRTLVRPGRSQADVVEEALERLAARPKSALEALTPKEPLDFDWEPARANIIPREVDFSD
jgi:hypothetical protein